ncbi:MAG TPA: LytTR family DNA-binding domain-containing protein, partial [Rhodothermales bacterium]
LKTVIVDDEAPARRRLRKLLEPMVESGRISIDGEAGDGTSALDLLARNRVDLLFLDVKMPEMDGFAVLERIEASRRPAVVFTTAFDQYALRAFETNAVDYLLKPISSERLENAVARSERMRSVPSERRANDQRLARLLDWLETQDRPSESDHRPPPQQYLRQISIPYRDRILIVPVERIISAEISEGITRINLTDEPDAPGHPKVHSYTVSYTLDQLAASLDPNEFLRVHRSGIVQLAKIREMIPWFSGRFKLVLEGGHELVASRERSRQLRERLLL